MKYTILFWTLQWITECNGEHKLVKTDSTATLGVRCKDKKTKNNEWKIQNKKQWMCLVITISLHFKGPQEPGKVVKCDTLSDIC